MATQLGLDLASVGYVPPVNPSGFSATQLGLDLASVGYDPSANPSGPSANPSGPSANPSGGVDFQKYLNQLNTAVKRGSIKGARGLGSVLNMPGAGMALPAMYGAGSIMGGDVLGGVGEIGGGVAGTRLSGGLAKAAEEAVSKMGGRGRLLAPIAGGAVRLAGGLLGGAVGGGLASGIGQAAQVAVGAGKEAARERGESPGLIPGTGKGLESMSMEQIERLIQMQPELARQLMPTYNAMRNADMNRQMQLNQQLGQLTGALNQQKYMAQLAGGAQQQAGETTRSIMTAPNPYAQSVFSYGA